MLMSINVMFINWLHYLDVPECQEDQGHPLDQLLHPLLVHPFFLFLQVNLNCLVYLDLL